MMLTHGGHFYIIVLCAEKPPLEWFLHTKDQQYRIPRISLLWALTNTWTDTIQGITKDHFAYASSQWETFVTCNVQNDGISLAKTLFFEENNLSLRTCTCISTSLTLCALIVLGKTKIYFNFLVFLNSALCRYLKSFPMEHKDPFIFYSQCHGYWWPGDTQSSHGTDCLLLKHSSLIKKKG